MFRRLTALNEHFTNSQQQGNYNTNQMNWYGTKVPNLIPSTYAAPKELAAATQNVNPRTNTITQYLSNISQIFRPGMSAPDDTTQELLAQCTDKSPNHLDNLIKNQDPTRTIRCGWLYTPSKAGGPPLLSQGWLGTGENTPLQNPAPPLHSKFFWNLEEAKKQIWIDRCKGLTSCNELNDPAFEGCGFSTERSVGIPINANGTAMYPEDMATNSATDAIITDPTSEQCINQGNRAPIVPGTTPGYNTLCTPDENGLLSIPCLRDLVIKGECSSEGSLAKTLALSDYQDPMGKVAKLPAFQMYNQRATEDRRMYPEMYKSGQMTKNLVVSQFNGIKSYTVNEPEKSALGAAARDLCLQDGDFSRLYDDCADINPDTTSLITLSASPVVLKCLQKEFLKRGGTQKGLQYPSNATINHYQTLGTYKNALNYMDNLNATARGARGSDAFTDVGAMTEAAYKQQSDALQALRGIVPDLIPDQAPKDPGVEVFWYTPGMLTLLGVTIESTVPIAYPNTVTVSSLPNELRSIATTFMVITDVAVPSDQYIRIVPTLNEIAGNYYNITFNRYLWYYTPELTDTDKIFSIITTNSSHTAIVAKNCWTLRRNQPNVLRALYVAGPGPTSQDFNLKQFSCTQMRENGKIQGTMTREKTGPFYIFEPIVFAGAPYFADLRTPERVIAALSNTSIKMRDETIKPDVPGTRGYVTINSGGTVLIDRIALTAWSTVTFAFNITDVAMSTNLYNLISITLPSHKLIVYINRSDTNAVIRTYYTVTSGKDPYKSGGSSTPKSIPITLYNWYLMSITISPDNQCTLSVIDMKTVSTLSVIPPSNNIITNVPKFRNDGTNQGVLTVGHSGGAGLALNLAWVHFFNQPSMPSLDTLKRDAVNNWKLTLPPQ